MMSAIGLTDHQLALVLDNAKRVDPQWRSRWLSAVCDRLIGLDPISDEARPLRSSLSRQNAPVANCRAPGTDR